MDKTCKTSIRYGGCTYEVAIDPIDPPMFVGLPHKSVLFIDMWHESAPPRPVQIRAGDAAIASLLERLRATIRTEEVDDNTRSLLIQATEAIDAMYRPAVQVNGPLWSGPLAFAGCAPIEFQATIHLAEGAVQVVRHELGQTVIAPESIDPVYLLRALAAVASGGPMVVQDGRVHAGARS